MKEITLDGKVYVLKSEVNELLKDSNPLAKAVDGLPYVMVRTYSAGVFCGYIKSMENKHVVLLKARRIWYWDGAASLSQLAVDGTSSPEKCKFPCEVEQVQLTEVIEILSVTEKAEKSIKSVKIWKQ